MFKLVQFTGLHFLDLNPNSYDDLNNKVKSPPRSNLVQITRVYSLKIRIITGSF